MSANFTLTASNPRAAASPTSVVYMTVANALHLTIQNNSGTDEQLGGASSPGQTLTLRISANILSADAAARITVDGPWTIASGTSRVVDGGFVTIDLQPPSSGVSLPDGGSITLSLGALTPSATGAGLIRVHYQFDDIPADDLDASASLSSLAAPDPSLPLLVGDAGALRMTLWINKGADTNPLMVTPAPVTSDNAVANALHVNLLYQAAPGRARSARSGETPSGLVTQWDPLTPPTFRVFFPYFTPTDRSPAAIDLTDAFTVQDGPIYNALTSAWNIIATLSPVDSTVQNDGFWQIALDASAPMPVWQVTPTMQNAYLFTGVEGSPDEPGPFLDWYLEQIVSALIDPRQPATILYLQWTNFPGFNDGLVAYPLAKTALAITSFTCAIERHASGPQLVAQWTTTGAGSCTITGATSQQPTKAQAGSATYPPYVQQLTSLQPMQCAYTLTAIGEDETTQVSRTIVASWSLGTSEEPCQLGRGSSVATTTDGSTVLVIVGHPTSRVGLFHASTLQPLPVTPLGAGSRDAMAFAVSPDGAAVFIAGADGLVYGYDLSSYQQTPGTPAPYAQGDEQAFLIAVSLDAVRVLVLTAISSSSTGTEPEFVVLAANPLALIQRGRPPVDNLINLLVGPRTGNYFVVKDDGVAVLDPNLAPISASTAPLTMAGPAVLTPDESRLIALAGSGADRSCIVALETTGLDIVRQLAIGAPSIAAGSLAGFTTSADGSMIFAIVPAFEQDTLILRFRAYDSGSLQEYPWSPVDFGGHTPIEHTVSPDGSRIFVLTADKSGATALAAIDPRFA